MLRIAIVGPESSGKTTLTEALAQHYGCAYTEEYARSYLEGNGPGYVAEDLIHIASGQLLLEGHAQRLTEEQNGDLLLCDTDMLTIRIWSEEKFGRCHSVLQQLANEVKYDHWLLCRPDIPWRADPLRENPHDRDRLFVVYEAMLKDLGRSCTIIEGAHDERMRIAIGTIDTLLHRS